MSSTGSSPIHTPRLNATFVEPRRTRGEDKHEVVVIVVAVVVIIVAVVVVVAFVVIVVVAVAVLLQSLVGVF